MNPKQAELATKLAELLRDYDATIEAHDLANIYVKIKGDVVTWAFEEVTVKTINADLKAAGRPEIPYD